MKEEHIKKIIKELNEHDRDWVNLEEWFKEKLKQAYNLGVADTLDNYTKGKI